MESFDKIAYSADQANKYCPPTSVTPYERLDVFRILFNTYSNQGMTVDEILNECDKVVDYLSAQ